MNIRDYFKPPKPTPYLGQGDFWDDVRNLCTVHIERMIDSFKSRNAPLIEWAEPRFRALVAPSSLDKLIGKARNLLDKTSENRSVSPINVDMTGSWFIMCSVFPSAADKDFLAACPTHSYEEFALRTRRFFRGLFDEIWGRLDFAHWILLLDEPGQQASIHLHTIWSLDQNVKWALPSIISKIYPPVCIPAPAIVPTDLMKQDTHNFLMKILQEDASWRKQQRQRE